VVKLYKNLATALKEADQVKAIKISLCGKFPEELFLLTELEEAYLEGSCDVLPMNFKGWSKLKILSVKWEGFTGDLSALFRLPTLQNLKIIETSIKTFLLPLGLIPAPLKHLTIKSCGLEKLPEEVSMLQSLEELQLQGNELNTLPFAFKELKQLKRLNLDQNRFQKFPDQIRSMPKLGHLSIDGNEFSEEEKERIQREFHIWPN
jgi:Leucine-rich repeat (LRR) protein